MHTKKTEEMEEMLIAMIIGFYKRIFAIVCVFFASFIALLGVMLSILL